MPEALTIAHLTDVHLGPIAGFGPRHWTLKRLLGYANWLRHRRGAYRRDVLDRLVADVRAQAPDHIVVTGDLVNIGLPQEHIAARAWLESLGAPRQVTVIPGNHDVYSRRGRDPGAGHWAPYMAPCEQGAGYSGSSEAFPFVRLLGKVALIGVNSAVPTPPLVASGSVGRRQLARLAEVLERLRRAGAFRLVLIHHPPLPGQAARFRGLEDAQGFAAVLARHGAELVVHGHNHRNMLAWCSSGEGKVPVIGAPSASLGRPYGREPLARYNLYRIAGPPWAIEVEGRGLAEPEGRIVELERGKLAAPGAAALP
jgi:3',5'-cyclic AMP phosphodiesterase CpdA